MTTYLMLAAGWRTPAGVRFPNDIRRSRCAREKTIRPKMERKPVSPMQITLTIPDDIAAQAQARGLSVEAYVQNLIEQQARSQERQTVPVRTREEIESFFSAMSEGSQRLPSLPTSSFTRESFYEDCR
jgi:post-segregation antitoxin (ccd killing protein)